ncbi:hypothetical protein GYMLUDRAFT_889019, partial [Collybiopsis luxurians FD-317 M1]
MLAFLLCTVFEQKVLQSQQIVNVPEAKGVIGRVVLYSLASMDFLRLDDSERNLQTVEYSARILGEMHKDWEGFWKNELPRMFNNLILHQLSDIIARRLVHVSQARRLHFKMLYYWFHVLATTTTTSDTLNQQLLQRRSVFFATHLLT